MCQWVQAEIKFCEVKHVSFSAQKFQEVWVPWVCSPAFDFQFVWTETCTTDFTLQGGAGGLGGYFTPDGSYITRPNPIWVLGSGP